MRKAPGTKGAFALFALQASQRTRNVHPMLIQRWASVADDGTTLYQHWVNVSRLQAWQTSANISSSQVTGGRNTIPGAVSTSSPPSVRICNIYISPLNYIGVGAAQSHCCTCDFKIYAVSVVVRLLWKGSFTETGIPSTMAQILHAPLHPQMIVENE